jgi:drug/metabolite transporter (DMT)-like permease
MDVRLSVSQVVLLFCYAAGMAGGQLLFKAAAVRFASEGPIGERLVGLLSNGYFLTAVALYAALTVLWVWVLSFTPLSRAYPFLALAFVLTPAFAALVFGEPLSLRLIVGTALILGGLMVVAG